MQVLEHSKSWRAVRDALEIARQNFAFADSSDRGIVESTVSAIRDFVQSCVSQAFQTTTLLPNREGVPEQYSTQVVKHVVQLLQRERLLIAIAPSNSITKMSWQNSERTSIAIERIKFSECVSHAA